MLLKNYRDHSYKTKTTAVGQLLDDFILFLFVSDKFQKHGFRKYRFRFTSKILRVVVPPERFFDGDLIVKLQKFISTLRLQKNNFWFACKKLGVVFNGFRIDIIDPNGNLTGV